MLKALAPRVEGAVDQVEARFAWVLYLWYDWWGM